jgi:hypothetical protein
MDYWTAVTTGAIGLTNGWLTWEFVNRAKTLEVKAIGGISSLVGGGAALAFWRVANGGFPSEANTYFVGVLAAILMLGLLQYDPDDPQDMEKIDAWRRRQADLPSRREAIRRLVELGLKVKAK